MNLVEHADIRRPNAIQWLRYVYTGRVARRNAEWVLYDATCSTWAVRHAVRYLMLVAPLLGAVLLFLPAAMSVRVEACVAAGGSLFLGYLCFTTESLEHRVERAGYPYGLAAQLREERATATQRAVAARARARREGRLHQRG
jgi:hypothetical protein